MRREPAPHTAYGRLPGLSPLPVLAVVVADNHVQTVRGRFRATSGQPRPLGEEVSAVVAVDAVAHENSCVPAALGTCATAVGAPAAAAITPLPSYDDAATDHVTSGMKVWWPPPDVTVVQGVHDGGKGGKG